MNKKISTKQMTFSVSTFIISSSLLLKQLYLLLKQDAWIGVILGYLLSLPILLIYQGLIKKFPSKSLIEWNDIVFGRIFGKLISALYVFFFLSLSFLNLRVLGDFVKDVILPRTPMAVILIMFMIICAWALRNGIENLTRCGFLITVAALASILINSLLLIKEIKLEQFLPMFHMPLLNYAVGAHWAAMMPICDVFVIFMLMPLMQKPEEMGKAFKGGFAIGAIALLLVALRDISVMGSYVIISANPSYSVLRLINIGNILTRVEIIYAVVLILLLFFKESIFYFSTVSGFSQLMKFKSDQSVIRIFGALIVIYAIASFPASYEHTQWLAKAAAVYSMFFVFILPSVTLIVAAIRQLPVKGSAKPA